MKHKMTTVRKVKSVPNCNQPIGTFF